MGCRLVRHMAAMHGRMTAISLLARQQCMLTAQIYRRAQVNSQQPGYPGIAHALSPRRHARTTDLPCTAETPLLRIMH